MKATEPVNGWAMERHIARVDLAAGPAGRDRLTLSCGHSITARAATNHHAGDLVPCEPCGYLRQATTTGRINYYLLSVDARWMSDGSNPHTVGGWPTEVSQTAMALYNEARSAYPINGVPDDIKDALDTALAHCRMAEDALMEVIERVSADRLLEQAERPMDKEAAT